MGHDKLMERQQRLLARSATLRATLANQSRVIQRPLAMVDRVGNGLQWIAHRPYWPAAAATLLLILKPGRVLTWSGQLYWVWSRFQKAQKLLKR